MTDQSDSDVKSKEIKDEEVQDADLVPELLGPFVALTMSSGPLEIITDVVSGDTGSTNVAGFSEDLSSQTTPTRPIGDSDCHPAGDIPSDSRPANDSGVRVSSAEEDKLQKDFRNALLTGNSEPHVPQRKAQSNYQLKRIIWQNRIVPIVTQNQNGPCPLIAIANVLLLRGKVVIPSIISVLTADQLMEYVADCIVESIPKNLCETAQLNYEQNMHDAIDILPQLVTGLDVNIRFTGVTDFEYTPECIIFDLLNIPLYHGWLVDPQAKEINDAIGHLGYNQLVEKIINNKFCGDESSVTEALTAEMFLESTATQLTYHGLCELNTAMVPCELAVFFRNNHFSTIYKKGVKPEEAKRLPRNRKGAFIENGLYQLVTDQGLLNEPRVVWETISNIEGDGMFVDGNFINFTPRLSETGGFLPLPKEVSTEQQINQDFLVALSLQEDQATDQAAKDSWEGFDETGSSSDMPPADLELARHLQEKDRRDMRAVPSPSSTQLRSPDRSRKGSSCSIL